jgi:Protein of unknown function (DUF2442)
MLPRLVYAEYVRGYTVHLKFDDGAEGDIDLGEELYGEMFLPLKDIGYFKQVRVDPEIHTIVWPNGADFAPEFLYGKIRITA